MWIPEKKYKEIIKLMPIPCVDLIVENSKGEILLLKRKNEPAKGQWWFPGGRVYLGETRVEAAIRKLKEECGVHPVSMNEIGTYDVILKFSGGALSHGITTIFKVKTTDPNIILDKQSILFKWDLPQEWLKENINDFIHQIIRKKILK